ncbi:MAG: hypothetical protein GY760_14500 [Deltaproteobacteria bacterium]|nr:hypothetical protein [Deltaproteobacteria bacterium]
MDNLKTAKDDKRWGAALIDLTILAKEKGMGLYGVWHKHAMSIQVHTVEDILKFGINPTGQPKW